MDKISPQAPQPDSHMKDWSACRTRLLDGTDIAECLTEAIRCQWARTFRDGRICKHPSAKKFVSPSQPWRINEPVKEILQYLKSHGEQLDTEIAVATGIPLANVHLHLSELAAKGELMACHSIKFEKGKKIEGISCRLVGHIPPAAPGRKSKIQLKLS